MCDGFVFYRSFYEAVEDLPPEEFKRAITAIMEYGLNNTVPEGAGMEKIIFALIKPQIDANRKRRENGQKGGRPRKQPKPAESRKESECEENKNHRLSTAKPKEKVKEKEKDKVKVKENVKAKEKEKAPLSETPPEQVCLEDFCPEELRPEESYVFREIIDYLNEQTGKNFQYTSKETQRYILARLKEGFSIRDFRTVIDKKAAEWNNTEWRKYLQPSTLFGPKFEEYLNQTVIPKRQEDASDRSYDLEAFEQSLWQIPTLD